MNGFIRATHENGVYRNLPEWKNELIDYDYLQFLHQKHPKTLYEIVKAVITYNEDHSTNYSESLLDICKSLIDMIQYDMVRVVPMSDYFSGV
jgi:hypothetical protein